MNYYDEVLEKIRSLIKDEEPWEALSLIEEELKAPYVPLDFEKKLEELKKEVDLPVKREAFTEEEIFSFLKGSKEKQLLAVNELNKKNLRDYTDLCNEYLCSEAFLNAKVLLVDSLIRQEISETIFMKEGDLSYEFIPKYLLPVEESDAYLSGKKTLEDRFLKEPSKLKLAMDLLYKELILKLPVNFETEEGTLLAENIISYVSKAFE